VDRRDVIAASAWNRRESRPLPMSLSLCSDLEGQNATHGGVEPQAEGKRGVLAPDGRECLALTRSIPFAVGAVVGMFAFALREWPWKDKETTGTSLNWLSATRDWNVKKPLKHGPMMAPALVRIGSQQLYRHRDCIEVRCRASSRRRSRWPPPAGSWTSLVRQQKTGGGRPHPTEGGALPTAAVVGASNEPPPRRHHRRFRRGSHHSQTGRAPRGSRHAESSTAQTERPLHCAPCITPRWLARRSLPQFPSPRDGPARFLASRSFPPRGAHRPSLAKPAHRQPLLADRQTKSDNTGSRWMTASCRLLTQVLGDITGMRGACVI